MLQKVVLVFAFFALFGFVSTEASASANENSTAYTTVKPKPIRSFILKFIHRSKEVHPKGTAIALTATLGPFGAHRIYLGTHYSVPLFYTVTLGGGLGVLPASDLLVLIFTKDITKYYDNSKIFMWDVD